MFRRTTHLLVCFILLAPVAAARPQFSGPCPDIFPTGATFKLVTLSGPPSIQSGLIDVSTVIGRSDPHLAGDPADDHAAICAGGMAPYPNTLSFVGDAARPPVDWYTGPATRREVHTEILKLSLSNGFVSILAGQPYYDSVAPGGVPGPQFHFFRHSTGEVASEYDGVPSDTGLDFPARSFFDVFVEVDIPAIHKRLFNKMPLVVKSRILQFPPDLSLPGALYIHDSSFGAVTLFDEKGLLFGYLLSAGHGAPDSGPLPLAPDAELTLPCPASFGVDDLSLGLDPTLTMKPPDEVFADAGAAFVPLALYVSSGAAIGSQPDMSNAHSPGFVFGPGLPPGFQNGDVLNSISFGRDGTVPFGSCGALCHPKDGGLFFSVSRGSRGAPGSAVAFSASAAIPEAAADVYLSAADPFGRYSDMPVLFPPPATNILAADNTALGLRPANDDIQQDNVTGLELHVFNPSGADHDWLYATFRGPSFVNQGATIYMYDPALGPYQLSNLQTFAVAASMGLRPGDIIDALALSDASGFSCPNAPDRLMEPILDEVLFSLAPGSPTLWGPDGAPGLLNVDDDMMNGVDDIGETGLGDDFSPATIFYSNFIGIMPPPVYAGPVALGLLKTDDVDAIDVKPGLISPPTLDTPPSLPPVPADMTCQAAVPNLTDDLTIHSDCDTVTRTQVPLAGTLVSLGTTVVTITATDGAGHTASITRGFVVRDVTPPVVSAGPAQMASADANCMAPVPDFTASASASDNCGGVTLTQSPPAGTQVSAGTTVVTITATDGSGNSASSTTHFIVTPSVCNDGDPCTTDACVNGVCVFTPMVCNDNDPCTTDACVNGVCVFTPIVCNDNDPCTTDACVNGVCVFTPIVCDDGDPCTIDTCVNGVCVFTPIVCNDNDPCTTDACVNGVCVFTPIVCNDGDPCTSDACVNGVCVYTPIDTDGDGIPDCLDNCPMVPNPNQANSDMDAFGDACDNCDFIDNPTQADCNGNGIGDACEGLPDCNMNGVPDSCDITSGFSQDVNGNGVPDECEGRRSFCAGDGLDLNVTTACPCGNFGASGHGCANSVNSAGALLTASGLSNPDTIVLAASGMPLTVSCIYLQGDAAYDTVFGDGVRCAGGSLIRLRTKTNVGGASQFPEPGDPSVSTRGMVAPGSGAARFYQTYYRNASAVFCPPATFNVTNGIWIVW